MVQYDHRVNLYGHQECDAVPEELNLKIVLMVRQVINPETMMAGKENRSFIWVCRVADFKSECSENYGGSGDLMIMNLNYPCLEFL